MYILYLGIILLAGYLLSILAEKLSFPKIVGYLVAGLLLNPQLFHFIPNEIKDIAEPVTLYCLAFITFEIGSSFSLSDLKDSGKKYFKLAFYESFGAFLLVFITSFLTVYFIMPLGPMGMVMNIAFSLLLASLAAPTDPSATLAVIHEYKAKGPVSKAILGAAAFDDIITLILFSLSLSIARSLSGTHDLSYLQISYTILYKIVGAILTGIIFGFLFNKAISIFKISEKKSLVIIFLGFLSLTFGLAGYLKFDELFSTLTLGFVIRNFNKSEEQILNITENDLEDLFFLIFFVFSAMHFDFQSIQLHVLLLIVGFIIIRLTGKYLGMAIGTRILKMPREVIHYAFAGLIPQGGIVLGLALMIGREPGFESFSNLLAGIIMGATIIHEFSGPVIAKMVLRKAREIDK